MVRALSQFIFAELTQKAELEVAGVTVLSFFERLKLSIYNDLFMDVTVLFGLPFSRVV